MLHCTKITITLQLLLQLIFCVFYYLFAYFLLQINDEHF